MVNTKGHRSGRRAGFTMTEAITALVILATAVPAMMWSVRQAHGHRANRILASRAHWLAVEKLEDVIADRHSGTRGYNYLIASNYPAESSLTGFPGFSRTVAFNETGANLSSPGSGYMRVTVAVSYADAAGASRTFALVTELTDYTP